MKQINYRGCDLLISEDGKIYSADRIIRKRNSIWHLKGKELVSKKDKDGYLRVRINVNGKRFSTMVHRLVAMAYIPNPYSLPCINHKDENKANNHKDNLEWCSIDYNNKYNDRYSKMKRNYKGVCQCFKGDVIAVFPSIKDAAKAVGGHPSNIGNCCHGRLLSTCGYQWKFNR